MDEFETYDNEMLIDYVDEDFENKQRNYFKYLEITFTLFVYFIAMDENCLFSCFSYHLHNGNTLLYDEVRQNVMSYIELNKLMYENFNNYDGKIFQTFEEYIIYMKLNQNWGDNLEIQSWRQSPLWRRHHIIKE